MDDVVEQYRAPKKVSDESNRPKGENRGFYVKGGPWEQSNNNPQVMPDTSNAEEFPSMFGGSSSGGGGSGTGSGTGGDSSGQVTESTTPRAVGGWGIGGSRVLSNPRPN